MRVAMRILIVFMALLLLTGLVLQYNDPDPFAWMAIYGAALLVSLAALLKRLPLWQPLIVGIVALLWAATLAVDLEWDALGRMFDAFEMQSEAIEEAREAVGLGIIAAWMGCLALMRRR
jgi:hypothetical protein